MKKRIIIVLSILVIISVVLGLYHTYATDSTIDSVNDTTYDITLTGNNEVVKVPKKTSKTIYYQISNINNGAVRYGVGYTSDNIKVKVWYNTIDDETGLIDYGEHKFIKLKLINDSTIDSEVKLSTILGYEHGGDLIVPEETTLVTDKIKEINYIMPSDGNSSTNYLRSNLKKEEISSITFVNTNVIPDNMTSVDVSKDSDGTVMMWYGKANSEGLYDVYIGSDNGITSIYNGEHMFRNLTNMKWVDLSYIDTSKVTDMSNMFQGCSKLVSLDLSSFDTHNVTNMKYAFESCSSLTYLDLSNFNTSNVTNMGAMFSGCSKLINLELGSFDTSKVTNMASMFGGLTNLTILDLSGFDTSKVTDMSLMFRDCKSLTSLNLSHFKTSKVTSMVYMFYGCSSLKGLNLSSFNTSNVTSMSSMFNNCSSLTSLDLSNFDISKVTDMHNMFNNCSNLTELDLSSFNTLKVNYMYNMFNNCFKLNKIDFRNANFSNVTNYENMFANVPNNSVIYVKDSTQKDWIEGKFTNLTGITVY